MVSTSNILYSPSNLSLRIFQTQTNCLLSTLAENIGKINSYHWIVCCRSQRFKLHSYDCNPIRQNFSCDPYHTCSRLLAIEPILKISPTSHNIFITEKYIASSLHSLYLRTLGKVGDNVRSLNKIFSCCENIQAG